MPCPKTRPIRAEDVAFADSAATIVAAESANATSSPLIGTTRAVAYRIRITGRDRHPIAGLPAKDTYRINPMT